MKILCLVNPMSGNGAGRDILCRLQRLYRPGVYDIVSEEMDPLRLDEQVQHLERYDFMLIGGGDGTISMLLPHIIDRPIRIGIIPLGTANDLAKEVGLYKLFDRHRLERWLEALAGMNTKPLSVWKLEWGEGKGALFCNYVSFGFDAAVVSEFSARRKMQACSRFRGVWLNRFGYVAAGWRSFKSGFVESAVVRGSTNLVWRTGGSSIRSLLFSNIKSVMGLAVSNPNSNAFDGCIEAMSVGTLKDYITMLARHKLPLFGGEFIGSAAEWEISGLDRGAKLQLDGEVYAGIWAPVFTIKKAGEITLAVASS